MKLTVRPLTPDRWPDLETVFNGAGCAVARGCWCMYFRHAEPKPYGEVTSKEHAAAAKRDLKKLVDKGPPPGLLAYRGDEPVGWVTLAPRERFARLERSTVMKAVDEQPVWSIVCFVVPRPHRGQGVATALLAGAVKYARQQGATLLEAYPVDKPDRSHDDHLWFGAKAMYDKAGFTEVARRRPQRPVVRIKPG